MIINDQAISSEESRIAPAARSLPGSLLAILIAISPKCPLCWAAYLSLLGLSGTVSLSLGSWMFAILVSLFLIHLIAIGRRAVRRHYFLPLLLSGGGFITMILGYFFEAPSLHYPGMILVLCGSITNALPFRKAAAPSCCQ
jgi:protein SCO1/2